MTPQQQDRIKELVEKNIRLLHKFGQKNPRAAHILGGVEEMKAQLLTSYFMAVRKYVLDNPKVLALSTIVVNYLKWELMRVLKELQIIKTPANGTLEKYQAFHEAAKRMLHLHGGETFSDQSLVVPPAFEDEVEVRDINETNATSVANILRFLDSRSRFMIELRFGLKEVPEHARSAVTGRASYGSATLDECAAAVGITRERARQIIDQAIRKMRTKEWESKQEKESSRSGPPAHTVQSVNVTASSTAQPSSATWPT